MTGGPITGGGHYVVNLQEIRKAVADVAKEVKKGQAHAEDQIRKGHHVAENTVVKEKAAHVLKALEATTLFMSSLCCQNDENCNLTVL